MKTILQSRKPYVKSFLLIVYLAFLSFTSQALNYYWIGGTGNWTDLSHWATSSGGTTLQNEIPTAVDDVFFDANSFTSTGQTITFDAPTLFAHDISFVGATNNPTVTFFPSSILKLYGSLILVSNMITNWGNINFEATNAGHTITTAGHTIYGQFVFNGNGGSWTLADDLTTVGAITLNNGTLNTNDKTINAGAVESTSSNARTLNMGASVFNLLDPGFWNIYIVGINVNCGTSVINSLNNSGLPSSFTGGGQQYYDVNIVADGNINSATAFHDVVFFSKGYIGCNAGFHDVTFHSDGSIMGNNVYNNLNLESGRTYSIYENYTQTINGALNANGSCTSMIGIYSDPPGNATTISHPAGNVNVSFVLLKDIHTAGAANFTANNSVDLGDNAGWTINAPTPHNLYWIGNGGDWDDGNHWSFTSGGAASGCSPTPLDNVFFDANSFSSTGQTVSINAWTACCKDMDWTAATNSATLSCPFPAIEHRLKIYGSLTYSAGMNLDFYGYTYFEATSTGKTIRTNGQTFRNDIIFHGIGGEWILQDELNSQTGLVLNYGTLTTNNQTVNAGFVSSEFYYTVRGLNMGSSVFNLYATGSFWSVYGTNMTLNCGTSVINSFSYPNGSFLGGNLTYYDLNFIDNNAVGNIFSNNSFHDVVFQSTKGRVFDSNIFHNATFHQEGELMKSNSYNDLNLTAGFTYILNNNTTQTVNGNLNANGNCGALININSILPDNQANISHPPGVVNISFTILKDINATGGANFTATNSIDLGNNSGWNITSPPSHNLYWIGDGGNWSDGNHWSFTSGGSPSGCSPTPLDNVFFDANSFTATAQNVVLDINTAYCHDMNWTGALYNPQLSGSPSNLLMIYGSITLINGMDWFFGGSVYFLAIAPGNTITMAGKMFLSETTFNGTGGEWTLMDTFNTYLGLSLQNGTLNTNDQTVNAHSFHSSAGTARTLNMGASVFNLTLIGSAAWDVYNAGITLNCGTSEINCQASYFYGGNHTYYDLNFLGGPGHIGDANHFHNVHFYGTGEIINFNTLNTATFNTVTFDNDGAINASNIFNNLNFTSSFTYTLDSYSNQTINNHWQIQGSCVSYILLQSSTAGIPATVTKNIGDVPGFNIHIKDIHATGGALFHAYNSVDLGGNSGWDFSALPPLLSPNPVVGPSTVCPGATGVVYHSTPVAGAIYYEWLVPPGATIISGQGDTIIVVDYGPTASSGNIILQSFNGCNYGTNASVYTIIVATPTTPTISLTSLPAGPSCPGTPVTFTATLSNTNIGAFTYNFKVNNITVQNSTSDSYTTSGLSNNDVVVCEVAVTATSCSVASTIVSNPIVITIAQPASPSVTIAASPGESICSGESISFAATVLNTGNGNIIYNFMINGISVQNGTSNIYSTNTISNGDQVSCVITINGGACLLTNNSSSNIITVTVIPLSTPSINIVTATTEVCSHDTVSFSANINNGGNNPAYQWQVNGVNAGSNNSSFTTNNLQDGDFITCLLTSGIACAFNNTALSNSIRLKVINCDCSPIVPNAITPNGDGVNDRWVITRENCIKKVAVSVYNRYGSLVYHSDDYHDDWNGNYKQRECPDGTYYYVMHIFYLYRHEQVTRGNITILR